MESRRTEDDRRRCARAVARLEALVLKVLAAHATCCVARPVQDHA